MPDDRPDLEMDEDVADELRREYSQDERTDAYWHGYNIVRKIGRKRRVRYCPYHGNQRREFFRGVSDARSRI